MRTLINLISINFKNYFREPEIIFWALIFPAVISGVLGVAFQEQERPKIQIAVVASAEDPAFRSLRARLSASAPDDAQMLATDFVLEATTRDEAIRALKQGRTGLYLTFADPHGDSLTAHFDNNNPEARLAFLSLDRRLREHPGADGRTGNLRSNPANAGATGALRAAPVRNPGGRYIDFLIPGLLSLGIMNASMWGVAYGLIDLRSKKLLRRMIASPMPRSTFLISHFFSRLSFAVIEACMLWAFAYLVFDVRLQGGLAAAALIFFAGNVAWGGIAIFCSSRAESATAANGILNAVTLPMTILSGIFFSYHNFPEWSHVFIQYLPLTLLADSLRAVFIEGAGLAESAGAAGVLLGTGAVFFGLGLRIYRWH